MNIPNSKFKIQNSKLILILGAGGHAQVVADILLRMVDADHDLLPVGFVDDNPELVGREFLGLRVLGTMEDRSAVEHGSAIVAIGNNQIRRRLFEKLLEEGEQFITAQHPRAVIAPDVTIGQGSMICAGVVVNTGAIIGSDVILNTGCTVDHHNHIGDHAHIAPGVHLGGDVHIGAGALIGIGATVMPGRRVGAWSVVGAGTLVRKDVQDGKTVVGNF